MLLKLPQNPFHRLDVVLTLFRPEPYVVDVGDAMDHDQDHAHGT